MNYGCREEEAVRGQRCYYDEENELGKEKLDRLIGLEGRALNRGEVDHLW